MVESADTGEKVMRYALANCTKTVSEDGQDLTMTGYSLDNRPFTVKVKLADMNRWLNGELVQVAFPYLSADEREVCMTGIDSIAWEEMFAGGDND
jgi:hypothetical protein